MPLTITEALAEIKTISKRLEAKRNSLAPYIGRQEGIRDPLEKSGGSEEFLRSERQSITDLHRRVISLRRGIQHANDLTTITIGHHTRTISEWLTWRREIAPSERLVLNVLRQGISTVTANARKGGLAVNIPSPTLSDNPANWIINLDEAAVNAEVEILETTLGTLDGQLSLKNATILITE